MINIAYSMQQIQLRLLERGGKRAGAGRKRTKAGRASVPHRARPRHNHAHPVHVTLRMRGGLPALRHAGVFAHVRDAIGGASRSPAVGGAFRVVEFSIQNDHAHFIVEAHDKDTLSRGLRGLAIRLARAINRAIGVRGPVWGDRYHARDLKTPRAVRNALVYVLMNAKKHGVCEADIIDPLSSARWFTNGFAPPLEPCAAAPPIRESGTWLGTVGWRRRGLLRKDEHPRAPR